MEREFGALKGLMGANGLTGGDIMPDIGKAIIIKPIFECNDLKGCSEGCEFGCRAGCGNGCEQGCTTSNMNG